MKCLLNYNKKTKIRDTVEYNIYFGLSDLILLGATSKRGALSLLVSSVLGVYNNRDDYTTVSGTILSMDIVQNQ